MKHIFASGYITISFGRRLQLERIVISGACKQASLSLRIDFRLHPGSACDGGASDASCMKSCGMDAANHTHSHTHTRPSVFYFTDPRRCHWLETRGRGRTVAVADAARAAEIKRPTGVAAPSVLKRSHHSVCFLSFHFFFHHFQNPESLERPLRMKRGVSKTRD